MQIKTNDRPYSKLEACFYGVSSLINNNIDNKLFHKTIIDSIENKHFDIEAITLVKILPGLACDVITKDKKGHRSFYVELERNTKFSHVYRIFNIKEQKIKSAYQWREE